MESVAMIWIFVILLAIVVVYFCFIRPLRKKSNYAQKENNIVIGMTESDMIAKCGNPDKTVTIDADTKLVTYFLDEWKGFLFGGTKRKELTATIKSGKVTNVSSSN